MLLLFHPLTNMIRRLLKYFFNFLFFPSTFHTLKGQSRVYLKISGYCILASTLWFSNYWQIPSKIKREIFQGIISIYYPGYFFAYYLQSCTGVHFSIDPNHPN